MAESDEVWDDGYVELEVDDYPIGHESFEFDDNSECPPLVSNEELPEFPFPPACPVAALSSGCSPEQAMLNSQWEATLDSVQSFALPKRNLLFPWERGFAGLVFNSNSSSSTAPLRHPIPPQSKAPSNLPPTQAPDQAIQQAIDRPGAWPVINRRISSISWEGGDDVKRVRALKRLQIFFQEKPEACGLGRLLMKDILALESESHITSVISDVFVKKATRTLAKRAASLTNFLLFCKLREQCPLPITENMVYSYLVAKCSASPSKAQQFCEALNFCISTLQCDGIQEATSSPRVKGFCFRQAVTKKPFKQAEVLKVDMVAALETMVSSESEFLPDRIFSGHCSACVHGRFRWSDSQAIESIWVDEDSYGEGFLQAHARDVKTATTVAKKTTFLPLTALLSGVSSDRWAQQWLELREEAGLKFGNGKPVMPGVTASGAFSEFELDTDSATRWLKEILRRCGFSEEELRHVSSHSLKATALSWAAKFGISRDLRQVLGYHIVQGSQSALHYSRDEQALPLRKLQECYASIRDRSFLPDNTRSGYLVKVRRPVVWDELEPGSKILPAQFLKPKAKNVPTKRPLEHLQVPLLDSESEAAVDEVRDVEEEESAIILADSSTSNSSSSDDSDLVDVEIADIAKSSEPFPLPARLPAKRSGERIYVHKLWCTVHKGHSDDPSKLACGRPIHAGFSFIPEGCNLVRPNCSTCFGTAAKK